jgi:hypothetical protein
LSWCPDSPKLSFTATNSCGAGWFKANTLEILSTSKDVVLFSSNYTFVLANDFRIASSSNFIVWMLITSAEIPFASNASAAISASQTNVLLQQ